MHRLQDASSCRSRAIDRSAVDASCRVPRSGLKQSSEKVASVARVVCWARRPQAWHSAMGNYEQCLRLEAFLLVRLPGMPGLVVKTIVAPFWDMALICRRHCPQPTRRPLGSEVTSLHQQHALVLARPCFAAVTSQSQPGYRKLTSR